MYRSKTLRRAALEKRYGQGCPGRSPEAGIGSLGGQEAQDGCLGSSRLLLWHRDAHIPSVWVRTDRRLPRFSRALAITL